MVKINTCLIVTFSFVLCIKHTMKYTKHGSFIREIHKMFFLYPILVINTFSRKINVNYGSKERIRLTFMW